MQKLLFHISIILSLWILLYLSPIQMLSQSSYCVSSEKERQNEQHLDFTARLNQIEDFTKKWILNPSIQTREIYEVTLVLHIIYQTEEENISEAQIQSQLEVLNRDFQALNEDYFNESPYAFNRGNPQIQFVLASTDPEGNATTGINRRQTEIDFIGDRIETDGRAAIKHEELGGISAWDERYFLNVWIGDRQNSFGEGSRPGTSLAGEDGVVIDPAYFGTIEYAAQSAPYNLGRICTHEMGHYFNLIHPWGLHISCPEDDLVEDTPLQEGPHYTCGIHDLECGNIQMLHNYMDYTEDACMYFFTKGQIMRMWACLNGPRISLVENPNAPTFFKDEKPYLFKYIPGLQAMHLYFDNNRPAFSVSIFDLAGKRHFHQENIQSNFLKIDGYNWQSGGYVLCLQSDLKAWCEKFIVY